MGYQTWIPDRLREYGVPFIEYAGWQNRGSSSFDPRGLVIHHDAFSASTPASSILDCMVNGRPDLAGPLCNIWIDDDKDGGPSGDPVAYVIAAGRANHAGSGGWKGLSGNSSVLGIEARNNGLGEPWTSRMLDVYAATCAALMDGINRDTQYLCCHREWAPDRKIDPTGIDGNSWRSRVQGLRDYWHGNTPIAKGPDAMLWYMRNPHKRDEIWRTDGMTKSHVSHPDEINLGVFVAACQGVSNVGSPYNGSLGPMDVDPDAFDSIPNA